MFQIEMIGKVAKPPVQVVKLVQTRQCTASNIAAAITLSS